MLRVSKLTDYATVVLSFMANRESTELFTATELSEGTGIAQPTVRKLLKLLTKADVLVSIQGAKGGYSLKRAADETTVASIIRAIEGPLSITECSASEGNCEQESNCSIRWNWGHINQVIQSALDSVTLADMISPPSEVSTVIPLENLFDANNRLQRSGQTILES